MHAKIATKEAVSSLESLLSKRDAWLRGKAVRALFECRAADEVTLAGRILREQSLKPFAEWVLAREPGAIDPELQSLALKPLEAPAAMILMRNVHKYLRRVPISQRRLFCKKVLHSELTSSSIQAKIWEGAVPTLGDEKSEAMIPELSRALAHPDKDVRFEATTQLGRTYSPLAVPAFLEALKDD